MEFIKRSRDYSDDEWESCVEDLAARGLLTGAGTLIDELGLTALRGLDDSGVERLFDTLSPLTRLVVAGGDLPSAIPMGLRRDELDDDSAHL